MKEIIKEIFEWAKPYILVCSVFFSTLFLIAIVIEQHQKIQTLKERIEIKPQVLYITKVDSVFVNKLQTQNDSLKVELFVAKYKLARIKEYNELGQKGNNFRYLPGWINRALEEHPED